MLTVMALSGTGNGKSGFLNWLHQQQVFESRCSPSSVTMKHEISTIGDLQCVDTVGFCDTDKKPSEVLSQLYDAFLKVDTVHAIAFVHSVKQRFTAEAAEAVRFLITQCGRDILRNAFLVFTHADLLPTIADRVRWLEALRTIPAGREMLELFGSRHVFVNCCVSAYASTESVATRATVLRLARSLPAAGYSWFDFVRVKHQREDDEKKKADARAAEAKRVADEAARVQAEIDRLKNARIPVNFGNGTFQLGPGKYLINGIMGYDTDRTITINSFNGSLSIN